MSKGSHKNGRTNVDKSVSSHASLLTRRVSGNTVVPRGTNNNDRRPAPFRLSLGRAGKALDERKQKCTPNLRSTSFDLNSRCATSSLVFLRRAILAYENNA